MAEIAKTYNEKIQSNDTMNHTESDRHKARKRAIAKIPEEQNSLILLTT